MVRSQERPLWADIVRNGQFASEVEEAVMWVAPDVELGWSRQRPAQLRPDPDLQSMAMSLGK